jgi:hypothetical protein
VTIEQLTNLFENSKFEIRGELDDRFIVSLYEEEYFIYKAEVDEYLRNKAHVVADPETSFFYPGHYEQLVEYRRPLTSFSRPPLSDTNYHLVSQDGSVVCELSHPSTTFILHMFAGDHLKLRRSRLHSVGAARRLSRPSSAIALDDASWRIWTIRVLANANFPGRADRLRMKQIAEAATFNVSYGLGTGVYLSRAWQTPYYRTSQPRRESIQFPRKIYDPVLVSYYQLALNSESLMLGYIALYKILEHFFSSASESELHQRISNLLIQPEFSHTKVKELRQLVNLIRKHDQRMDEKKMLISLLKQHFKHDELVDWVQKYERSFGLDYSAEREVFGERLAIELTSNDVVPSLARRIYHVRNVLVHNKEGDWPRFTPFSGQEETLVKEVPLLQFLAEQLILRTGRDL